MGGTGSKLIQFGDVAFRELSDTKADRRAKQRSELSVFKQWHIQVLPLSFPLPALRRSGLILQSSSLPFVVYAEIPNSVEDSSLQLQHRVQPRYTCNWLVEVARID
jgi:hypothetical protein